MSVTGRASLAGTDFNHSFTAGTGNVITGMAVSASHIYWTSESQDTGNVGRTPIIGGQQYESMSSVFGEANPRPCGVAVDETYGYSPDAGSIGRANKNGTGVSGTFISGLNSPWGVAVEGGGPAPAPPVSNPQLPNRPNPLAVYQPGGGSGGGVETPRFRNVQSRHDVWRPGGKNTPLNGNTAASLPRGTVFSFVLDEAAQVRIAIQRKVKGRRVQGRCVADRPRRSAKPPCSRYVRAAPTLRRNAREGVNKVPFTGRIKGRALKPGRYRAAFTATAGGGTSTAATVTFRIAKP